MTVVTAVIQNSAGIHVRPSGLIFTAFRDSKAKITLTAKGRSTDLRNVIGLISLGLVSGDEVTAEISGPDEESVAARIVPMLERRYDFPPRG